MHSVTAPTLDYRTLPLSERIQLVEDIWDSIAEETSAAPCLADDDRRELHDRLAAHRADPSSGVSWDKVRADLFRNQS